MISKKPKVLFITGHSFVGPARVSVHYIARAAAEENDVSLFVAGIGPAMGIKGKEIFQAKKGAWEDRNGVKEYRSWQLATPVDLRKQVLNNAFRPIFRSYGSKLPDEVCRVARDCDLVVVESGVAAPYLKGLQRVDALRKTVYLAADDLRTVRAHPLVREAIANYGGSLKGCATFGAHMSPDDDFIKDTPKLALPKGIDTMAFDESENSPYLTGRPSVISVGNMLFDDNIYALASQIPEVDFHFIGRVPPFTSENVHVHGVMKFEDTVAYVKFANAGLLPYRDAPNMSYLETSSLKLAQFRYVGLPVICPAGMLDSSANAFKYERDDAISFARAVRSATNEPRGFTPDQSVANFRDNWNSIAQRFLH